MFDVQIDPTITRPFVGRSRTELTGVGLSGAVSNIPISKHAEITQLQINHTVGSGSFTIGIYSDSFLTDQIFSAISDTSDIFMVSGLKLIFQNTDSPQNSLCYVKITPSSGSGHSFKIALFFDKN